jgi:hypothetical protein
LAYFAPANARVTTTYYDTLWRQPILTISENNNPGQLSEYDSLGRLSRVYKFNKNLGAIEADSKTKILSKEYHVMGCCNRPYETNPADGGKVLLDNVTLQWKIDNPFGKNLTYDIYAGTSPDSLRIMNYYPFSNNTFTLNGIKIGMTVYWQIVIHDVDEGSITKSQIYNFTREYKPFTIPNNWSSCSEVYGDNGQYECHFLWNCIPHPNGELIHFRITYYPNSSGVGDTILSVTQNKCDNSESYTCRNNNYELQTMKNMNTGSGQYLFTIYDDYGTSITTGRFDYPAH